MSSRLDTATNIATLVACGAIVAMLLNGQLRGNQDGRPSIKKGEQIQLTKRITFAEVQSTLILAVRKDCPYCEQSVEFYRELLDRVEKSASESVKVVVVTTDSQDVADTYVKERKMSVRHVISLSPTEMTALKIVGTPTMILVDSSGSVKNAWLGKLNRSQESEVIAALGISN